jgi:hypothetical protein
MRTAAQDRSFFRESQYFREMGQRDPGREFIAKLFVLSCLSCVLFLWQGCSVALESKDAKMNGKPAGEYYSQFQSSKSDPKGLQSLSDGSTLYIYDNGQYELNGAVRYSGSWSVNGVKIVLAGYGAGEGLSHTENGVSRECIATTATAGGLSGQSLTFCK